MSANNQKNRTANPLSRFARALVGVLALAPLAGAAQVGNGVYLPFNDAPLGNTGAVLNGNAVFSLASPSFTVRQNGNILADLTVEGALTAEIRSTGSGTFTQTLGIGGGLLPPIIVSPLVTVQPILRLGAEIEGTAEPGMVVSFLQRFELTARIRAGQGLNVQLIGQPSEASRFGVPELTGTSPVSAQIGLTAELIFFIQANGISTSGPFVSADFGSRFSVDPLSDPWWRVQGYLDVEAGAKIPLVGQVSQTLVSNTFPIADAGGPLGANPSSTRWSRTFDLDQTEDATSIVGLADGFLVAGNGKGPSHQAWVAKLDEGGAPLWEQLSDFLLIGSRPAELHELADGSILAGGNTGFNGEPRVQTFDAAGSLLLSRRYAASAGGTLSLESIIPNGAGSVFAGRITRGAIKQPAIVYLDGNGDVEDALEFDLNSISDDAGFHVVEPTPDGGHLAVGFIHWEDTPVFADQTIAGINALLVKISPTRTLEYAKIFGAKGSDDAVDVTVNADGTYAICGNVGGQATNAWAAELDALGNVVWSGSYAGDTDTGNDRFTSIAAVDGAGYLVSGTTSLGATQESWTTMLSESGLPLWFKSLRSPDVDELVEIRALSDGLIAAGSTKAAGQNASGFSGDMWVVRASVDGMMHFTSASGLDAVNDGARWAATSGLVQFDALGTMIPLAITTTYDTPTFSAVQANGTVVSE